jgi:branched-chain amino acid transport system substrate-binding protein
MLRILVFLAAVGVVMAEKPAAAGQDTVKIGVLADMAGTSADIGGAGSVAAVELAGEDFGGAVAGRKIVVMGADHQAKPDIGASIAGRWFDVDGVDVIVDLPVSSVALAVQGVANDRKKLVLVTAGTTGDLTGKSCSPYTVHWAEDTNALANGTARAVVESGGTTWFFLTVDFIFGHSLEKAASDVIRASGGQVLGSVKTPLNTADYSSYLIQAQASKAKIIGLAEVGSDFINSVKQASEFGLVAGGQKLVGFLVYISDVHSLGVEAAQGLEIVSSFYWDANDRTRAFAQRFMKRRGVMPTKEHASNYAAVTHYLNAVKATGSTDTEKTAAWMKAHDADYFGQPAHIREDGRVLFDLSLFEVKGPKEVRYPWDYYKKVGDLKAEQAFRPIDRQACGFVSKN